MIEEPGWNWGNAWNKLRSDMNVLAWLFEEERLIQRLYVESVFWALTGKRFSVEEFATELGFNAPNQDADHDAERSAQGALDPSSPSEV